MKNKKLTKIFVAILSLALLVGAAIGITAAADETDTYAIKSINVAHGDTTQILVAVDAPAAEAENIEVKYTFDGKEYTAKYYKNIDIYENGTEYPVFYTKGIGAKDCGLSVVAEAHKKGTAPASPLYKEISVAEYLFTKLYVEGYISATEGEALDKKNLYVEFIDYISSAEEVLYNYKNPDNKRQLLNTKTYVVAEDAYVAQVGGDSGFFNSDFLALNYTGTEKGHIGWYVSTATKNDLVFGNMIALTESAKITPYFIDKVMDFDNATTGAGISTAWVGEKGADGKYTQSTTTVTDGDMNGIVPNYTANENIADGRIATGDTHVLIKEDALGNKYLDYKTVARTNYSGYTGDRSNPPGFTIPVTDLDDNANVTIWSFDAKFDSRYCSGPAQIMFLTSNGTNIIYPYINSGKEIKSSEGKAIVATFPRDVYVNIRFEYYYLEGVVRIFIDNVYQGSFTNAYGTQRHAKPADIAFGMDGSSAIAVEIDNMLAVNIYKTYSEEIAELPAVAAAFENFSGEYTADYLEWKCSHSTYKSEIENGKFTYGQSTEGYDLDTIFSATNLSFGSGLNVNHAVLRADLPVNGGNSSYSNANGAKAEIVTDENGNQYLSLFAPKRVSDRDRSYGVAMIPNKIDAAHTTYVFDADIRVFAGSFQFIARNDKNAYVQYPTGSKDGYVTFGGLKATKYNEWTSIRVVFYTATETPIIEIYVKDASGEYQLIGQPTSNGGDIANMTSVKNISFSPDSNSGFDIDNAVFYSTDAVYTPAE